jgi:hypothetical protein
MRATLYMASSRSISMVAQASSLRLALGGLLGRFSEFHVAGGQGPETLARFDGAFGQEDLVFPHVQTAPATTLGF